MLQASPFKASFGVTPPLLVGRDELIDEFREGIEDGPGAAARATLYTGARGAGKTVVLNAVEDCVRELGRLVVSETSTRGLVDRIVKQHLPRLLKMFDTETMGRRLTSITGH